MARQRTIDPRDREIGQMIAQRRIAAGLTQQQLSPLLDMSYQQLGKYERGEDSLRVTLLERIMQVLDGGSAGFAEEQVSYSPPGRTDALKAELLKSAERLEAQAKRLQELSEKL